MIRTAQSIQDHRLPRHAFELERDGARCHASVLIDLEVARLRTIADAALNARAGQRVARCGRALRPLLTNNGAIGRLAAIHLGESARPVRLVFFDKTEVNNWAVGWHQERTIAVKARCEADGLGPWSVKAGVLHVAPPITVLEQMVTVRIDLDDCSATNAPLLIAPGSHKLGSVKARDAARVARPYGHCMLRAGRRRLAVPDPNPACIPCGPRARTPARYAGGLRRFRLAMRIGVGGVIGVGRKSLLTSHLRRRLWRRTIVRCFVPC